MKLYGDITLGLGEQQQQKTPPNPIPAAEP